MRVIGLLTAAQDREGYLSESTLRAVAAEAKVPLHQVQQVASFYPHFRFTPPPRVELAVCRDMSCHLKGSAACIAKLKADVPGGVEVHEVSCIGRCDQGPVALLNGIPVSVADTTKVNAWLAEPATATPVLFPAKRHWANDPYTREQDHYSTVANFRQMPDAERAITELKASGLRGMGGAGFPTGIKWDAVRKESSPTKYVICNADESEPGTFKDAQVLRDQPHLVLEGMALAGAVVGAKQGILFLRHEYKYEHQCLEHELHRAKQLGILHPDTFDIELVVSPGGYILGEETALLECLEDKRGEPRNKPPFPVQKGLHGQPTVINNVETFAQISGIMRNGAAWWQALGTPNCPGPKFFSISGHVNKPGVYQVPFGTTVRELIEIAGGMAGGKKLLAFAPGGASSNILPASLVDVKLSFNDVAQAGSMVGSGAVVVMAEGTDLFDLAINVVKFFRNESCGKCVPCRVGSQQAVALLEDVQQGKQPRKALEVLPDWGEAMNQTSICGLGQVALNPILSAMKLG